MTEKKAWTLGGFFSNQKAVVLMVLLVLFVLFSALSPAFRSYTTLITLCSYSYYIAFMAIGVTFVLVSGGVDLSLGTGMICYGLIGGIAIEKLGCPVIVGMLISVLVGTLFGLFNGYCVAVLKLPPFISTLVTMMITRGLGSIVVNGMSVTWPMKNTPQGWFRQLFRIQSGKMILPVGLLWIILAIVLMSYILNKTKTGRYIVAIGSNKEATRLSGVAVTKYHIAAYAIAGMFTGLAAVAYAATFQAIGPSTGGGLELDAIASAVIGGTSMAGGSGTIVGTLLGVLIISLLKTGLPFVGLQANWQQIITGFVMILAVGMDVIKSKKMLRKL